MVGRSFRFSARRLCDEKYENIISGPSPSLLTKWQMRLPRTQAAGVCEQARAQAMSSCFPFAFNNFVLLSNRANTFEFNDERKKKINARITENNVSAIGSYCNVVGRVHDG